MSETTLHQRHTGIRSSSSSDSVVSKIISREGLNVTNNTNTMLLETNEKILADIANFYGGSIGLCKIGELMNEAIPMPRRKITVLLVGNHSAGKSSFINWYIEQNILKTGVAIETQGFSFVTSGKKRDTLKGLATLQLYPHLKPLQDFPGVLDFLTTEISTSRARDFNMVTFIDTPGLVDGDMHYPYNVNETLYWLGDMADLVFVFFDPMGQALCKRTLNIVEKMWANYSDKIRLYLAKADEAGTETDRQKVLMQIVQELCKRPGLNRSGFDMPTIYLPDILATKPTKCANQIEEACCEVSKCIEHTVQNSLNSLESQCEILQAKVDTVINADLEARARNRQTSVNCTLLACFGVFLPTLLFSSILAAKSTMTSIGNVFGQRAAPYVEQLVIPLGLIWDYIPSEYYLEFVILCVGISATCLIISRYVKSTLEKVMSNRDLLTFQNASGFIAKASAEKRNMYKSYLRQSVSDEDFRQ